jgi:hypothetical protein
VEYTPCVHCTYSSTRVLYRTPFPHLAGLCCYCKMFVSEINGLISRVMLFEDTAESMKK